MNDIATEMQLEIERVLMEKELSLEQLERLEQMLRGAKEFLIGASPKELIVGGVLKRPDGKSLAEVIQAERFKSLGFSPEMVEYARKQNLAEQEAATEGLMRAAAVFGVTDDEDSDEEPEVEEVAVRVNPLRDREVWMPIGLIDRLIYVLADSDGDVADHLIDIVNDVRARYPNILHPDSILPIDINLVTLIAAGLNDEKVLKAHPEAVNLAQRVSQCVMKATEEKDADTFRNDAVPQSAPINKEVVNGN